MSKQTKVPYGTNPQETATLLLAASEETGDGQYSVLSQSDGYFLVPEAVAVQAGLEGEVVETPDSEHVEPYEREFDFSEQAAVEASLQEVEEQIHDDQVEASTKAEQDSGSMALADLPGVDQGEKVDLGDDEPAEEPTIEQEPEVTYDGDYDPTAHNVADVNEYLKNADDVERDRVLAAERARTDRDPRGSIDGI